MPRREIAIAPFLESCPEITTLGIRASLCDYSPAERKLLASADRVYFPTPRFAKILEAAGKQTFPSCLTYRIRKSRLVQETLFQFSGCPHPRTRIYFGRRKASISADFRFPFVAMGPGMQDGIFPVNDTKSLVELAEKYNPLIVREEVRYERRLWLLFVNYECIWIADGTPGVETIGRRTIGTLSDDPMLEPCIHETGILVRSFRLNDIAVEIGFSMTEGWGITSMAKPPVSWQSAHGAVSRYEYISSLIRAGKI
ncbi:MAG: hypothetical protein ABFD97_22335 [Syntrophobacter sp.]